jgi:L-cystine uptake protein TcyP (sodium:dicarboxylate symporter family)
MDTGLLHLHNILRWVILIFLLLALFHAFTKKQAVQKSTLFLMISAHTMLLIGLYQWLIGRYGLFTADIPEGVSMMKDKFYRFFQMEHPVSMLIAVVLITFARRYAKALKYGKVSAMLLIALLLILAVVPWPFRGEPIARPLFPGM